MRSYVACNFEFFDNERLDFAFVVQVEILFHTCVEI